MFSSIPGIIASRTRRREVTFPVKLSAETNSADGSTNPAIFPPVVSNTYNSAFGSTTPTSFTPVVTYTYNSAMGSTSANAFTTNVSAASNVAYGSTVGNSFPISLVGPEAVPTTDPDWSLVQLLVQPSGENGSTIITDLSTANRTITNSGMTVTDTYLYKSPKVLGFTNGGKFSIPQTSLAPGTGDYTIELAYRMGAVQGGYSTLMEVTRQNGEAFQIRFGDGGFGDRLQFCHDARYFSGIRATNLTKSNFANQWLVLSVSRVNSVTRMFLNGTTVLFGDSFYNGGGQTSFTDTTNYQFSSNMTFGGGNLAGHLDSVRITIGKGRYTSEYTPLLPWPKTA